MPLQKRNKRKEIQNWINLRQQKIATKKRLIAISLRVDGYIYRNKLITVEEAEKYLAEIAIHRTHNNDVHIRQVIEKLTRCLKTIIEETKKKLLPIQNATSMIAQNVDLLHSFATNHEDSNKILYDGNFQETIEAVSKRKDQDSSIPVVVVISDSEEEEKRDHNVQLKYPSFNAHCRKLSIKEAVSLNHSTIQHEQSINLNIENNKHLNPDESYCVNIADKTKEPVNNIGYLMVTKSKKPRQYKKKNNKNLENALQPPIQPRYKLETKNTKKKKKAEATQKPLPIGETLNLETTVNTTPKKLKLASKETKNRVPKKKTNKVLPGTTKKCKNSNKKSNININNPMLSNFKEHNTSPSLIAPLICSPIKHKHIDICNEVSLPLTRASNNTVSNTNFNLDSVSNEMGASTIYNDSAVEDVSWVENIKYVREISADEFEAIPSKITDTFWDDLSLPYEWKDIDFL